MPRRPVRGSRRSSGSGNGSQTPHLAVRHAERRLDGEQVVGDPHLVAVRVGAERQQRRVLCLPAEPADAARAGGEVGDDAGAAADAIPIPVERILQREQRVVGNRLDQAGAEQRNRRPPRDHVHVVRHLRLTAVRRNREHVNERVVRRIQTPRRAVVLAVTGAQFEDDAAAADGRHVVTHGAARPVERRAEAFFGGFDFREVLEPETELAELHRRQARQRRARKSRLRLRAGVKRAVPSSRPRRPTPASRFIGRTPFAAGSTMSVARMKLCPAPHMRLHSIV